MEQEKKKPRNFGLAAQLAQPRPSTPAETLPTAAPPAAEQQTLGASPAATLELDPERLEPIEERRSEHFDHTDHTKRRTTKQKKPGAPARDGGYVRRTITLGPGLSDYVDRAWRTYRTPAGKYVKGVSGFIEAVLDEHRRRTK